MSKYEFEPGGAWKSISGKKWERPLKLNQIGSAVRLFHDKLSPSEIGYGAVENVEHHDYDLDGRVLGADGEPRHQHIDNIMGGWVEFPHRTKIMDHVTEVVDEGPVDRPDLTFDDTYSGPVETFEAVMKETFAEIADDRLVRREPPNTYSHRRYNEMVNNTFDTIRELARLKGGEYSGDLDRLANFRRNGTTLDLPMEVIWAIYANKHHDAVMQYITDIKNGVDRPRSEPISGRVDDLIVYLLLLKAMIEERSNA